MVCDYLVEDRDVIFRFWCSRKVGAHNHCDRFPRVQGGDSLDLKLYKEEEKVGTALRTTIRWNLTFAKWMTMNIIAPLLK